MERTFWFETWVCFEWFVLTASLKEYHRYQQKLCETNNQFILRES